MRLYCINDGIIVKNGQECNGTGLVKNEIYTTYSGPIKDKNGFFNYYIEELGEIKLCERFTPLDDNFVDNLLASVEFGMMEEVV